MKTTRLFSFLILISLVVNANAQLRVLSNGRVQAGLLKDNNRGFRKCNLNADIWSDRGCTRRFEINIW